VEEFGAARLLVGLADATGLAAETVEGPEEPQVLRPGGPDVAGAPPSRLAEGDMDVLLVVQPDPEADAEETDTLVRRLRSELAGLDVDDVRTVASAEVPEGAKSADPVTIGAIVIAMSASGGLFTSVIETVRDVLARQADRHKVVMTIGGDSIELMSATDEQRDELVRALVQRQTGG